MQLSKQLSSVWLYSALFCLARVPQLAGIVRSQRNACQLREENYANTRRVGVSFLESARAQILVVGFDLLWPELILENCKESSKTNPKQSSSTASTALFFLSFMFVLLNLISSKDNKPELQLSRLLSATCLHLHGTARLMT